MEEAARRDLREALVDTSEGGLQAVAVTWYHRGHGKTPVPQNKADFICLGVG